MNKEQRIKELKALSLRTIRERVHEIKGRLPKEKRNVITYSRNFTLSLSNYCQNQCGYCFYNYKVPKLKGEGNVVLIENEKMTSLIQKGLEHNCKEGLLISGERPNHYKEVQSELEKRGCADFIEFVKDVSSYLLDFNILPHTNIGYLSYRELEDLKKFNASMGLMLESTSMKLFEKGEVHEKSPKKTPEKRIKHLRNAGKLKIPFTTGLLLGIGENLSDRIKDLLIIKEIHEEFGHIQEVIIQNFIEKPGIAFHPPEPISIQEILKTVGIAKLIFGNEIPVQVPPNLIENHAEKFLKMGIDDFGGISPFTADQINPKKPWPKINTLKRICSQNGFTLKERLPIYEKYIQEEGFCSDMILNVINNLR
ncbi:MAG: 7,8-didemethyl-8-hydroxy-5-deazariboflavin synthase subunit CofG [Promethearchaeia archaeon]